MSGALNALLTIGGLAFAGWYLWFHTDFKQVFQKAMKPPALPPAPAPSRGSGSGGGGAPVEGGGGGDFGEGNLSATGGQTIFPSTGKKWQAKDSGKTTRNYASGGSSGTTQWDIKGVGPITNLEVTTYVNVGGCGDEVSLKVFGPSHSGSNCCWLIMNVDCNSGKFQLGGEGPHPDTDKTNLGTGQSIGSIKNKEVGIKLVVFKTGGQYTAIGYADTGGGWKEMLRKSFSQFGAKKKSSTPNSSATVQFRTDCKGVKYRIAEAAEITPSNSAGFARAMNARVLGGRQTFYYAEQPQYSTLYYQRYYNNIPSC